MAEYDDWMQILEVFGNWPKKEGKNVYKPISREELITTLSTTKKPMVVEALPGKHFKSGHLPGAIHLPPSAKDDDVASSLPDKWQTVVTYCSGPTCDNSRNLAERLVSLGFEDVRVYVGGKSDWADARLPLEEGA